MMEPEDEVTVAVGEEAQADALCIQNYIQAMDEGDLRALVTELMEENEALHLTILGYRKAVQEMYNEAVLGD